MASLRDLQEEASCPLCLDFLRDPVTTDCGHNFCGSCIHQCWEDLQDTFPCPVCLHHCSNGYFKRNAQLCHMMEIVKQLPTSSSKRKYQEEKSLCEKHNWVVTLFCEQDMELLCAQCRVSSDHLMPLEQAAATHRKKLKSYIGSLKENIESAEKNLEIQLLKSCELKGDVEKWRRKLNSEFEKLECFLAKEQEATHNRLLNEEKNIEDKLTENISQISQYLSTMKNLICEITKTYVQTDVDLLKGIESIFNKHENLKTPEVFSYELQKERFSLPLQYFGLQKLISIFKVDLTLDPKTAHPNLIILEDRKTAIFGVMKPKCLPQSKAFTSYQAVRSCEGFDAGRHFWQVEFANHKIFCKAHRDAEICSTPTAPMNISQCSAVKSGTVCGDRSLWEPLDTELQHVAPHRKKLKSSTEPLKQQVEDAEKVYEIQVSKSLELRLEMLREKASRKGNNLQGLKDEADQVQTKTVN
ncbi:tripartite motif-containing protein 60-like [Choloepus didactylus]|uniref:tripartite motif-containing protein 60-like n=1 Tax=Choloepus didactylus TaxID=27675 RepID=UPI00189C9630|nr:tripartite motif-containing protein 60-like [Choloepus didactylus]